jgi:hypothetical protein
MKAFVEHNKVRFIFHMLNLCYQMFARMVTARILN